ncbi:hypothetical protein E4U41_005755 [Claviceps citrina]|nr:hypothetical protein E4U41_005755 [Claviceps citrina]
MYPVTLSLVLFTAASVALNGAASEHNGPRKLAPRAFIYEFADDSASGHETRPFYQSLGDNAQIRATFDSDLFRGVSVQYPSHEEAHNAASRMAQKPVVKRVWPVHNYPRPEFDPTIVDNLAPEALARDRKYSNGTFSPHTMIQVDKLRALGVTGKGIRVAIIDSGVDYKHEALGGCFGKGCLVAFGHDFVGDAYNGNSTLKPGEDPMDADAHGTHVAGIIAAQPNKHGFTGVAPGVTLGAYKVFGRFGGTQTDVLLAAILRAVEDRAHIITVSVGAPDAFSEDLSSNVLSKIAREKGIPCTVCGGNDGSSGAFYPSGLAGGPDVMSIASFDNINTTTVLTTAHWSVAGEEARLFGYVPGDAKKWDNITLPLWALNLDATVLDDGCSPFPANTPDLSRHVVLLRRGTCTYVQKARNAAAKGARYLMLYNNGPGAVEIGVTDVEQILASGMVSAADGEAWLRILSAGSAVRLHMADPFRTKRIIEGATKKATGSAVSAFSSWGPTMEMNFKPQFGAPGNSILSTIPRRKGCFGIQSGTSMATPMTAGVIALLVEYRGGLNRTLIRNLLSTTAKPQAYNEHGKLFNFLAPAAQQGAGLIQAFDAAVATTVVDPPSLAFNDTENLKKELSFTITNEGNETVTYQIGQRPAGSIYVLSKSSIYPMSSPNEVVEASASLRFSDQQAVIKAGASRLIRVGAMPPTGVDERRLLLWSGYITVIGTDGSSMSLPYEGLAGSLRQATTLAADASGIMLAQVDPDLKVPLLQPLAANSTVLLPPPGEATEDDNLPHIHANLALGSPTVAVSLAHSDGPASEAFGLFEIDGSPLTYVTRGSHSFTFDGKLRNGTYLSAGRYKAVFKALRIAGNASDPADWDTSETVAFSLTYGKK